MMAAITKQYYAEQNDAQAGPFDGETLAAMAERGSLTADTLVWRQGMADWELASTVPELASMLNEIDDRLKKEKAEAEAEAREKKKAEAQLSKEKAAIRDIISQSIPLKLSGGKDNKLRDAVQTGFFNAFDGGERNMQNLVKAAVQDVQGGKAAGISVSLKNGLLRGLEKLPSLRAVSDGSGEQLEQQRIALVKQDALQVKMRKFTNFILTLAALGVFAFFILAPDFYINLVETISETGIVNMVNTVREFIPFPWLAPVVAVILSFLVFKLLRRFNPKFLWRLFLGAALFMLLADLFYPDAALSVRGMFSGITGLFDS
jgi:hypothetical protein